MIIEILTSDSEVYYKKIMKSTGIASEMLLGRAIVAGIREGDIALGIAIVTAENNIRYLSNVYVLPEFRLHGIGRALVERLIAECILREIEALHLLASKMVPAGEEDIYDMSLEMSGTRSFLEKCGFLVTEEILRGDWTDILIMSGIRVMREEAA